MLPPQLMSNNKSLCEWMQHCHKRPCVCVKTCVNIVRFHDEINVSKLWKSGVKLHGQSTWCELVCSPTFAILLASREHVCASVRDKTPLLLWLCWLTVAESFSVLILNSSWDKTYPDHPRVPNPNTHMPQHTTFCGLAPFAPRFYQLQTHVRFKIFLTTADFWLQ